ncbi:MAG TPA: hypothetical protein PKK11_07390, partial [Methanothrix sp.]|nr:hypothetical protein [Methanothrix sp.]
MNRYLKIGLFGLFIWLIPFVVSVLIFPLRAGQRPLFESVMPVIIAIWTIFFSIIYFSKGYGRYLRDGIVIGLLWLAMSIALDLMAFSAGRFMMPLRDYVADIAITYLMIPAITSG